MLTEYEMLEKNIRKPISLILVSDERPVKDALMISSIGAAPESFFGLRPVSADSIADE